jgi:hypothetical protein
MKDIIKKRSLAMSRYIYKGKKYRLERVFSPKKDHRGTLYFYFIYEEGVPDAVHFLCGTSKAHTFERFKIEKKWQEPSPNDEYRYENIRYLVERFKYSSLGAIQTYHIIEKETGRGVATINTVYNENEAWKVFKHNKSIGYYN